LLVLHTNGGIDNQYNWARDLPEFLVINLIHNRKDIKVGDKISIEDNFCNLYDYEVLEVGDCELVVFEL
jgi:hypothetical protein